MVRMLLEKGVYLVKDLFLLPVQLGKQLGQEDNFSLISRSQERISWRLWPLQVTIPSGNPIVASVAMLMAKSGEIWVVKE